MSYSFEDESRLPEMPSLESGITLLETGADHGIVPIQSLAIDHVLLEGGYALWVGTGHHAVTEPMTKLAPSRRILDRINIARAFQAYQHTALLRQLMEEIGPATSLVVVPDMDFHYRADDIRGDDQQEMLVRAIADLAAVARETDVQVLVTREKVDEFSDPIEAVADKVLEVRSTPMGPRFVGEEFETLVYELENGWVQTTLAFWRNVLQARESIYVGAEAKREVAAGAAF